MSLFDSVGHDLTSGLISSVAMASCRTTRRSGGDLADIADRADRAIAAEFGASRFATALLCDLDVSTGEFTWLPCGHLTDDATLILLQWMPERHGQQLTLQGDANRHTGLVG